MKKILYFILIGLVIGMYSCKEESDLFLYDGPNYVSFIEGSSSVTAIGGETNEFPIQIGVTTAESSKTFSVEVDADASTGIEGTHFTVDSKEITIAAGEYVGTMTITPIFEAVPDEGITVKFNLVNTGDTADFSIRSHTIDMAKYCAYDIASIAGTYTGTSGAHNGPILIEASLGLNEVKVHELASYVQWGWGENWATGDGTCLMTFFCGDVVRIPMQWIGDSDYPDVYGMEGEGTYDEASNSITLTYQVYYGFDGSGGTPVFNDPITTTLTLNSRKFVGEPEGFSVNRKIK